MAPSVEHQASPALLRRLILISAVVYACWYWLGRWLLPTSFNPPAGRVVVIALIILSWAASFKSRRLQTRLDSLLALCVGLITCHYYYLFYNNRADIDWVVGAFITVVASAGLIFAERDLMIYSACVFVLSAGLYATHEPLEGGIFLGGVATVLFVANLAQRVRARLLRAIHAGEETRVRFEATKRALQMREEYIAILAHELKTPLTALKLRTQSTQRALRSLQHPKLDAFLVTHNRLTDRLARLVDDMLDTSRIQAGKLALRCEDVDMTALVLQCVSTHQETQPESAALTTHIDDGLRANVDAFRIEQVLQNLLMNTVKYGRGNPVDVSLHDVGDHIVLAVRDQGIGIAPDDHARIFERFERAVPARDTSGLGLGLFISEAIVRAHGGRLHVESVLGQGSTFTVTLPRQAQTAAQHVDVAQDDVKVASEDGREAAAGKPNQSGNGLDG